MEDSQRVAGSWEAPRCRLSSDISQGHPIRRCIAAAAQLRNNTIQRQKYDLRCISKNYSDNDSDGRQCSLTSGGLRELTEPRRYSLPLPEYSPLRDEILQPVFAYRSACAIPFDISRSAGDVDRLSDGFDADHVGFRGNDGGHQGSLCEPVASGTTTCSGVCVAGSSDEWDTGRELVLWSSKESAW